jgi:hypothetical protein
MKMADCEEEIMITRINNTFSVCVTLLLMSVFVTTVQAQQTDREISEQFLQEYQEVEMMITDAQTLDDLRATQDRVNELLNNYREYSEIINRRIQPETMGSKFEDLRVKFMAAQSKIRTIQRQDRSISQLRSELMRTRDRMDRYDQHINWLIGRVVELEERALAAEQTGGETVTDAMRERDRFVTEFLTDLLERYDAVDATTQQEMTEIFERLEDSPVDLVRTMLGEHLMYAQQTTDHTPTDLMNMKAQQAHFSNWWNQFGDQLVDTFESENPAQARSEINERLSDWSAAIDGQLWDAISESFSENGFELPTFSSSQEFYSAQENYIRQRTEQAQDRNNEEDLEQFRSYSNFWNQSVKSEWGDALTASAVMSHVQIANIDRMLSEWSLSAAPTQEGNLMTILFFLSLAVNIGLIVVLVRKNNGSDSA